MGYKQCKKCRVIWQLNVWSGVERGDTLLGERGCKREVRIQSVCVFKTRAQAIRAEVDAEKPNTIWLNVVKGTIQQFRKGVLKYITK